MKTIIRRATLVDGTGNEPRHNTTLVVENGRIVSIGSEAETSSGVIIEADDLTVLPGLIDTHVHATFNGIDMMADLMTPPSLALYRAIRNLAATLDAGITTVRDAGGAPAGLRMAVEERLFPGPRMKVAITILSQTGGHADPMSPSTCCLRFKMPDIPALCGRWGRADAPKGEGDPAGWGRLD